MKVVYATDVDSRNIHSWSGLGVYYRKMLEQAGCDVTTVDHLIPPYPLLHTFKEQLLRRIGHQVYSPRFSLSVSKHYAKQIHDSVSSGSIVLSPNTIVLAHLKKQLTKVLYADATFDILLNFYPKFSELTADCLVKGREIDRLAVANADLLIYTSQWAADSAVTHYGANPDKVAIVPFGANLDQLPSYAEVKSCIARRAQNRHVNLLFLGVDWARKGGDYAVEVTNQLNKSGFEATLHVVGADHLPGDIDKRFIVNHGYISKATPKGQQKISALLSSSHFLLLPTLADCTPVACSEANAFGVPCITSDVGGLKSIVTDNINGHTFKHQNFVENASNYLINLLNSEVAYKELCCATYNKYATELNWGSVGQRIVKLINSI
jgi:glycosyltransferase involved in cell wall biosynthesis